MSKDELSAWSESERALLNGILARIIPASEDGRIPSAASPRVVSYLAEKACAQPGLGALFTRGLTAVVEQAASAGGRFESLAPHQQQAILEQLEKNEPEFFEQFLRHTYMAYYSNPAIRPLFGLSDKPTQPDGYDVAAEPAAELAALVEPVTRRGSFFRG